tara:strand:- start:314 stop:613 length:300 start_codon:yes stop_codon:yes gene_type:complete
MLVTLTEIRETSKGSIRDYKRDYTLSEIDINPDWVTKIRPDESMHKLLSEGRLPEGLNPRSQFTRVTLNEGNLGASIVVVGDRNSIKKTLNMGKELLKG